MDKAYSLDEKTSFNRQRKILDILETKEPVVFDVGANIGQSIDNYKELDEGCTIYSFEPNPEVYQQLNESVSHKSDVQCYNLAFSDSKGEIDFYATNLSLAGSLLKPHEILKRRCKDDKYEYEVTKVKTETIDGFVKEHSIPFIDILKVDVQGAEEMVLKGAEDTFANQKIDTVYIEVGFAETYENQGRFLEIQQIMAQYDYVLWDISPFSYTNIGRIWIANVIYISRNAFKKIEKYQDESFSS